MNTAQWIEKAREVGTQIAPHAARHDAEGTFVEEGYSALKEGNLFTALVPSELGGMGAGIRDICGFIRELAHHCGSTALAYSMHSHLVAATVWKHKHDQPGKALLEKVVNPGVVLVSTGANDWLESNGQLEKVDGGYKFTSKKPFASGSPMGSVMVTSGRYDHPQEGPQVLHFPLAFSAEGVKRGSDWDTHGMRGTGSNTVTIEGAFIPDAAIAMVRPRGPWHPAFNVIATVALPILMNAYVGVAERAAELAIASAKARRDDVNVQYLTGELLNELLTVHSLSETMIENANEYDFMPDIHRASRSAQAKSALSEACIRTVSKAMEVGGGSAYFRGNEIERLMRDVRAAPYHPLQLKRQTALSGRVALGLDPV